MPYARERFFPIETEGRCYRCGKKKPLGEFAKDASKRTGRKSICKACDRERARARYLAGLH
jgi:hypothetical protein